jgi:hypothetical protein
MYVIVKEWGEYSGFDYKIMDCYECEEDAVYAVQVLRYKNKVKNKLRSLQGRCMEQCDYEVRLVECGSVPSHRDLEEAMKEIDAKYRDELMAAEKEHIEAKKAKEEADAKRLEEEVKERAQQVADFLAWWKRGKDGDPYFHEKKYAESRRIRPILVKHLAYNSNDADAVEWYMNHACADQMGGR